MKYNISQLKAEMMSNRFYEGSFNKKNKKIMKEILFIILLSKS
jgi:hypothetical protein